ncbi:MAG: UvrD-helicase domain-containing protein [Ilumatobacteraceae bacterium]
MSATSDLVLDGSPPPTGRVSIEASAGTGKTYSLNQLVVLHVIHFGVTPDQVLLVTFTRAATAELRHKTRDMCQRALHVLSSGNTADLPWLASVVADERLTALGIDRLTAFLSRYDEANISTIHGFCQKVLRRAGLASTAPAAATLVENVDDVVDQVVTDALAERLAVDPAWFDAPRNVTPRPIASGKNVVAAVREMRALVKKMLNNPGATVLPESGDSSLAGEIADLARDIVEKVRDWCARHNVVTHDDLVRLAADTIAARGPDGSYLPSARQAASDLARQLSLVMVDEFQDTDEMQWRIFESIHHHSPTGTSTLVTVGDAKQAIYRFRGADVGVYVKAEATVAQKFRLSTNRRSNTRLIAALERLFTNESGVGFPFDAAGGVAFVPVVADDSKASGLSLDTTSVNVTDAPVEIRWVPRDLRLNGNKRLKAGGLGQNKAETIRETFRADLADRVVELLQHGHLPDSTTPGARRTVTPSDIAILVNTHDEADAIVEALREVTVPAVQLKTSSVLKTEAAFHFRMFLAGVAHPHRIRRVKASALSVFGAMDPTTLLSADDETIAALQSECASDADIVRDRGVTALYLRHRTDPTFLTRVLSRPDGERFLTDLDHVAEVLAAHPSLSGRTTAVDVSAVLADLIDNGADDEERKRRIETDDDAVTIMTMHASKGLQFPIVILPSLHSSKARDKDHPIMFGNDFGTGATRVIDAASGFTSAANWTHAPDGIDDPAIGTPALRKALDASEADLERARLMYVALTRAEHKVIAYWSEFTGNSGVQWAKLLGWSVPKPKKGTPLADANIEETMRQLASAPDGTIATRRIDPDAARPGQWSQHTSAASRDQAPTHATFTRESALSVAGWRRWSYSGLTRILKGPDGTIEIPDAVHGADEVDPAALEAEVMPVVIEPTHDARATTSDAPLLHVTGGTALGTLIHEVFDEIDPADPNVHVSVSRLVDDKLQKWPGGSRRAVAAAAISDGIITALDCPLGTMYNDATLRDLGARNRLSELQFDHLLGQDSSISLSDVGALLAAEPGLDPSIAHFAAHLASRRWESSPVAGHMNGSIDAVLRAGSGSETRFFVVDYKSGRLHGDDDTDPLAAYTHERLAPAMTTRGYMLQALVYSVALHRLLRWRLGDAYDFETHFGGATYLFVRAMTGARDQSGRPLGVWQWKPSYALVNGLDRLFSGAEQGVA